MNMLTSKRTYNLRHGLYFLAFSVALVLRLINLGSLPLTELEAKWAMQALEIARGSKPILSGQPLYILLTAIYFFIFGASNFVARLLPALIGSALVFLPSALRKNIGETASIILAFGLAIDPGLTAASRVAGSSILSIGFLGFCLTAWYFQRYRLSGILAGFALLGGYSIWFGLVGLGFTILFLRFWQGNKTKKYVTYLDGDQAIFGENKSYGLTTKVKSAAYWGIGTLVVIGTLFFMAPNGLSAWAGSIVDYFQGWWSYSTTPTWLLLVALLFYAPLAIIFCIIGLLSKNKNRNNLIINFSGIMAGVFLLLILIYPNHQPDDLVWLMVPVLTLASIGISRQMKFAEGKRLEISIIGIMTGIFIVFIWLNMISIPAASVDPNMVRSPFIQTVMSFLKTIGIEVSGIFAARLLIIFGALLLFILCFFLVVSVWGRTTTWRGFFWGGTITLFLYTLSAGYSAAGLHDPFSSEMWQTGPKFAQADLLLQTMNEFSNWNTGHAKSLDVMILSELNSSSVSWLLRDWNVTKVDVLSQSTAPAMVVLPQGQDLRLSASYHNANFIFRLAPTWNQSGFEGWIGWLAFRKNPATTESLVLWVRDDLIPTTGTLNTPINP
jgi:hypothetical protein